MTSTSVECGDSDAVNKTPAIINLRDQTNVLSTADRLRQTLDYIAQPEQYLKRKLGEAAYAARQHLFCISNTFDKDIYGSGGHKDHLQTLIAAQLGKKHALFFITGVQAQLVALKIHCLKAGNDKLAWHASSHLESAEESAYKELYGLERVLLGSDPDRLPTVSEILNTIEQARPAVVLLELPNRMLGCITYTYGELEEIAGACRKHGTQLHLDGARLWEIMPYYEQAGRSIKDITGLFDSVYVSFYKGLGGITGAMLLTDEHHVHSQAQMWQRRAGGNPLTMMYETTDCERGYNENIGTFDAKWKKMIKLVEAIRAATRSYKCSDGTSIITFPNQPTCCQIKTILAGFTAEELCQARDRVQKATGIRVFDNLWPKYSLDDRLAGDRAGSTPASIEDRRHEIEWMVVDSTLDMDESVFVQGYVALCQELQSILPAHDG